MWNLLLHILSLYNCLVALSDIRNGENMIDEEIKIIIHDILCHTKEMLKFLKSIRNGTYNAYLDDLIDYALSTEEDIQTIEHYIVELEIKLYDILNGGDCIEK